MLRGGVSAGSFRIATKSGETSSNISVADAQQLLANLGATPLTVDELLPDAVGCTKVVNATDELILVCAPAELPGDATDDSTYETRAAALVAISDRLTNDPKAKAVIVTTLDPGLADHRKSIAAQGALVLDFVSPVTIGEHETPGFSALSTKGLEWFGYGDSGGKRVLLWAWAKDLERLNNLLDYR